MSTDSTPRQIPKAALERVANFKFESFNSEKDTWKLYFQRFELELNLLQLTGTEYEPHRRDLLLGAIGGEMFRIAAEHFEPVQLKDVSYGELTTFLSAHNTKAESYIIARVEFGQCTRDPTMSVSDYEAKLRLLAPACNFRKLLDERLRDQFLIGLKNPDMLEKIAAVHFSPDVTLTAILQTAVKIGAQKQRAALSALDNSSIR